MQPHRHFNTYHDNLMKQQITDERLIAQTFRNSRIQNEFNYERNVIQRLKSQQNQIQDQEDQIYFNYQPPSIISNSQRRVVNDFITLIYRQKENYVTYDEFHVLLSKLKICIDPEANLIWFRQLDEDQDNFICLSDFQSLLNQDIFKGNMIDLIEPELILKVALEIFYFLSEDSNELDLKKVMNFIKYQMQEQIDFVCFNYRQQLETIEMFGFVQDLYCGQVKTNVSLQNFLLVVCPQLKKSLSKVMVRKCQQIFNEVLASSSLDQLLMKKKKSNSSKPIRHGMHVRNTNSFEQLFQPKIQNKVQSQQSTPFQTQNNESLKSEVERLIQQNFHLNLEVDLQDQNAISVNEQEQIVNYLKENRPKIKGWLQRQSTKKANKWNLLFFQIDQHQKSLKAIKTQKVKKIIDTHNAEFFVVQQKLNTQQVKNNCMDTNKPQGSQQNESNFNNASQLLKENLEYILIREVKEKVLVLRSYDAKEIYSIIKEINDSFRMNKDQKSINDEHLTYSGIVSFTEVNEKNSQKQLQQIEKLIFKEFFLVIKEGKLLFYNCQIKHEILLDQLSIGKIQSNLPFVPSHPFPFLLIKKEISDTKQIDYLQVNKRKIEHQLAENIQDLQGSVIMWQIDEDDNESENENKKDVQNDKRGLFDMLKDKFLSQKLPLVKEFQMIFAAESELKRRQWIFSINYYKSSHDKEIQDFNAQKSNKSSYSQQAPSFSHYQIPLTSQQYNQQSPFRSSMLKSLYSQNNQLFIGGNHTHINMNILNLDVEDDYYDIFKDNRGTQQRQKQNYQQQKPNLDDQHCHTDPNEQGQNKEQFERLITLPSNNGVNGKVSFSRQCNQIINSTTSIELWQKFTLSLFRYLRTKRGPFQMKFSQDQVNEESQEPQVQRLHTRRLNVCKPK